MKFNFIYDPVWANVENTRVNVKIDTDKYGTIPFTASPDDSTEYGPVIYAQAVSGTFGDVAEYVPPVVTEEQILAQNTAEYTHRMRVCTDAAFPLQSAISLGTATPEQQAMLADLQDYAVQLLGTKSSLTQPNPAWPVTPAFIL